MIDWCLSWILGSISPSSFFYSSFLEAILACILLFVESIFSACALNLSNLTLDLMAPIKSETASWFFLSSILRELFSCSTSSISFRVFSPSKPFFYKEFCALTKLPTIDSSSGIVLLLSLLVLYLSLSLFTIDRSWNLLPWIFYIWESFWPYRVFYRLVFFPFLVFPGTSPLGYSERSRRGIAPEFTLGLYLL